MAKKKRRGRCGPRAASMLAHAAPRTYQQPYGEIDRTRKWYAAITRVRRSQRARERLSELNCTPYRPVVYEGRVRAGKVCEVAKDALTRYVFFTKPDDVGFGDIQDLDEVATIVEFGDGPVAVCPDQLQRVVDILSAEEPASANDGLPPIGGAIWVTEGPFAGFMGWVVAHRGKGALMARMNGFGHGAQVRLERSQVRSQVNSV